MPMRTHTSSARPERSVRGRLWNEPRVEVVASVSHRRRLIGILKEAGLRPATDGKTTPDATVLAVDSPATDADTVTTALSKGGSAPVVLVVGSATPADARRLLVEGIAALVFRAEAVETLPAALYAVLAGHISYPRNLMPSHVRDALSKREKQILAMVVLGFSNAEIAAKLYVSESTVKSHLSSAFATLGVRSRKQATSLILDPDAGFGTGILAITDDSERAFAGP